MLYDAHCHLDAAKFILKPARLAVASIELNDIQALQNYKQINNLAKIGAGLHPWHVENIETTTFKNKLKQLIEKYHPDFIGECGLDLLKPYIEQQITICEIHCELAIEYNLPIIFHCVRAYNQLLQIIAKYPKLCGMVHGFNANSETTRQFAKKNISIGIGSLIMNPNSQISKSIIHIPVEQILIESDSPYMPLSNHEISTPDDCLIYAQKLAELTKKSPDEIITKVNLNWTNLFG